MKKTCLLLVCCGLSFITMAAQARNTRILLPIQEIMRSQKTKDLIGSEVKFYFGDKAPQDGSKTDAIEIYSRGEAKPYVIGQSGRHHHREDEPTCRHAMRQALADLVQQARTRGGNSVIEVSSFYNRVEMRSNEVYECHAGMTRAVVELKGKVVRLDSQTDD